MKIKNLKSIALVLLCTMLNINYAWGTTWVSADEAITEKDGITISMSNMAQGSYYQIFKSSNMVVAVSTGNITSIVITCTTTGTSKYGPGSIPDGSGYTASSSYTGTWTGSASSVTLTASNNQVRITQIVVTTSGGGGTTYTVSYFDTGGEADHGDYSASSTSVSSGSTVTLTATPDAGYKLSSWSVYKEGDAGTTVTVTNNQFTMPAYNVVVKGTFESKGCTDHYGNDVETATETSGQFGPIYPYYNYSTRQILYTKADLGLAAGKKGIIKSIYFKYGYTSAMTSKTNVDIYMVNSDITELSTSAGHYVTVTSSDKVYSGALNGSGEDVWNEIVLTTPFNYDGAGNLIVVIDDNSGACEASGSFVFNAHTTSTDYSQLATHNDYTNADPSAAATWTGATTSNIRPSTKFCIQEQDMVACTVTFDEGSGSCGTDELTEPSAGAGVTLPAASHSCDGWDFAGWANASVGSETTSKPTLYAAGSNYKPASNTTLYAVYKETRGGSSKDYTLTIGYSDFSDYSTSIGNKNASALDASTFEVEMTSEGIMNQSSAIQFRKSSKGAGVLYNANDLGNITDITLSGTDAGDITTYINSSSDPDSDAGSGGYFKIINTTDNAKTISSITISFTAGSGTTYYYSNPVCCSGEKVGTPVVTATPSNAQIQLTWPTVTNATAYKLKWNGGDWETVTSPVTKSGLTNGTSYTYQVKAIGNGTTYCDGDPSAEASCVAGVSYTVTWMNNGDTHATTYVLSGEKPTFPATPISCDVAEGGESTTFYGWAEGTWIGKTDDISGETIYTSADDMPAVDGAVTYHAVFAKGSAGATLLLEDFSSITEGNNTSTTGSSAAWTKNDNFSEISTVYKAGGAIKLGGGSSVGSVTTKQLTAAIGDVLRIEFDVKGWSTVEGDIQISAYNGEFTTPSAITYSETMSGSFESKSIEVTLTKANPKVILATTAKRAFLDNIVITKKGALSEYMTSCTPCENRITISKGSESHGTFTLSKSGEQGTCSGPRVVTVTPTPDEHYRVASVTASNPATTGTAAVTGPVNNAYTVTYSQNSKGATTISVTFEAIPQHTISLSPSAPDHGTTSLEAPGTTSVTIYEGTIVNLRATPDECYELGSISITPESGYSELEQVDEDDYQILGITNNLTVAVTYAQRTQYTITLDAGAGTSSPSVTQVDCGSVTLPSATPSEACATDGWEFAGWSRTKVNGETNTPPVLIPAGSFTPTASETLYAVYKQSVSGGATYWVRVYDDTKLSVNDSVIIADNEGNNYAMANQCNTNYRCEAAIGRASVNGDTLTSINASVVKFILQSGKSSGTYAFYDPTTSGYLCAQSAKENYLKTQTTLDGYGSWEIDINSISGDAAIEATEGARNMMLHNNTYTRFSCYSSDGDQTFQLCLYTKAMGSSNVYNSIPSCLPCVSSEASLSSSALSLSTGKTSVVTLTSANTSAVSATSADPTIATVSVVGKELTINGLKEGETTITVEQDRDDPGESGHCEVYFELVVSVTTSTIEIIEWEREAVIIEYDGDADASVVLGKEVEHGSKTGSVATELFFSKYFEAAGTDKLFGIFNGTEKTIDLTDYFVWVKGFGTTLSLASYGATAGEIAPKEEIIFYTYGSTKYSKECMDTVPGHEKWNEISWEGMQFSGRHSIGLYRKDKSGNDSIIDIIGATVYDKANPNDYDPDLVILNKATGTGSNVNGIIPSWGDESGFNAEGCGDNIMTKNDVETAYGLSTNRCLLVRKNTVTSGANAVAKDTTSFDPNDDPDICAAAFQTLCSEWSGYHVVGKSSAGQKNTCEGMSEVAKFDYSNYYVTMETFSDDTEIGSYSLGDGTYRIPLPDLDTLACRLLRIQLAKDGEVIASSDPKVPIVVDANMSTNSLEFYKHSIDTCKVCDVVVRDNSTLTKAANGAANDRAELRNITVYSGSHLIIPSGATNMKASSIVLRSLDDTVSTASFVGGIQFKDAGYHAYHSKRIKENRWYWFCLPHACRTNRITWQDGSLARLGTDFHLKYYDGEQRAATQSGGCWKEYTGSTIQPGVGYILSVEKREGHAYRELIFPMDTISEGETTKPVSVDDYGAGEDITPNHKGWNLVGNPYMTYYQKNTINAGDKNLPALTVGKLNRIRVDIPEEPTKHLLTYEILTDGVNGAPFITVPRDNGSSEYAQVLLMDYDLPPFISYFVQIGDDAAPSSDPLYVNFAKADLTNTATNLLQASYVRKRIQEMEDPLEPILVTLHMQNGKNESDETTLIISDLYSNDYEIGSDLGKMFGDEYKSHSKPVFYSKMEDNTKLAFRSMPDSAANEWTPLGFWGYNTQPITVSLRRNNRKLDYVESVMLYDKTMNTYTELLTDDYVLYPTKQGLFGSRLSVKVKVKRPTPAVATGMDEAHEGLYAYATGNQQLVVAGIPEHATVWLYDALGKLIAMENTSHYMRTYTLPSSGVYFVRVNNEQGQRILRVIIK